jgi:high-affinity Fe2+/Pb2+ permease
MGHIICCCLCDWAPVLDVAAAAVGAVVVVVVVVVVVISAGQKCFSMVTNCGTLADLLWLQAVVALWYCSSKDYQCTACQETGR